MLGPNLGSNTCKASALSMNCILVPEKSNEKEGEEMIGRGREREMRKLENFPLIIQDKREMKRRKKESGGIQGGIFIHPNIEPMIIISIILV